LHNARLKVCATFPEALRKRLLKVPSFDRKRGQRHNSRKLELLFVRILVEARKQSRKVIESLPKH
jgi:hypothetical protein